MRRRGHVIRSRARHDRRIADRERADLQPRPTDSARAAPATRPARRRCCRSRDSNRRAAAASRRRRRARADRESRSRTPRDSAGAAADGRDWDARVPRRRARSREMTRALRRQTWWTWRPAGGIAPLRSFCSTFSKISACSATLPVSDGSRLKPPVFKRSLWHVTQYWLSVGGNSGNRRDRERRLRERDARSPRARSRSPCTSRARHSDGDAQSST